MPFRRKATGSSTGWASGTKKRLATWATKARPSMAPISGMTSAGTWAVLPMIMSV